MNHVNAMLNLPSLDSTTVPDGTSHCQLLNIPPAVLRDYLHRLIPAGRMEEWVRRRELGHEVARMQRTAREGVPTL